MLHVTDAGNGYIVAKSLWKSTKAEIAWAISPEGYDLSDEKFRCKSWEVERKVKLAAMIDDEKLSEFNALFGYYQIWSKTHFRRIKVANSGYIKTRRRITTAPRPYSVSSE